MINITEENIRILTSNPSTLANGKKLVSKKEYLDLGKDKDNTVIFGKCKGSGKNPYSVSVDFSQENPVFRCSCPSRQIPCKHAVGLMVAYNQGLTFETAEIPEDLAEKMKKYAEKKEKKEQKEQETEKKPKKTNSTAAVKKMKKQVEAFEMLKVFIHEITESGIGGIEARQNECKNISKQLGDAGLRYPQQLVNALSAAEGEYEATDILTKLYSLTVRCEKMLGEKIEAKNAEPENSMLNQYLGTPWKTEQLEEIGRVRENTDLVQLSFDIHENRNSGNLEETGYWVELSTGEIMRTLNIRPLNRLKYVQADDSIFSKIHASKLYIYPAEVAGRIKYVSDKSSKIEREDIEKIRSYAYAKLADVMKQAKGYLKNTLSANSYPILLRFSQIGFCEGKVLLEDCAGERIQLDYDNKALLDMMPAEILKDNVIFGELLCGENQIMLKPHSILIPDRIIRLVY